MVLVSATIIHGIPVELFQILKGDAVKVLHSISQQIWKTQQWPQDWKRSAFIPIPNKGNAKECSNYLTIDTSRYQSNAQNSPSQASAVKLQMFKLVLEKAEDPEITLPTTAGASKN